MRFRAPRRDGVRGANAGCGDLDRRREGSAVNDAPAPRRYDLVTSDRLSGDDLISNFDSRPGDAADQFDAPAAGEDQLWVRANPIQSKLSYELNGATSIPIAVAKGLESTDIAADGKLDLRLLAWANAGAAVNEPFTPQGTRKPDQVAASTHRVAQGNKGWFAFRPTPDRFSTSSGINLRALNEKTAGDGGWIGVKGSQFVHTKTGEPVRFWAVNEQSGKTRAELRTEARILAKHGVNLVRIHHGYFKGNGDFDAPAVRHALEVVEAMKTEGIYSHFSIYFPVWLKPQPGTSFLKGYDGSKNAFAALFFNPEFQKQYLAWWKVLLLTKNPSTGTRLIDEPAVAGLEIVNEDSYLFWTFSAEMIPDAELRISRPCSATGSRGSTAHWIGHSRRGAVRRSVATARRRGESDSGHSGTCLMRSPSRDKDTTMFLVENQREFYHKTYQFLRRLGFKGVITASNWHTASPEVFGPLEKYTYTVTDFIDRHSYFGCHHQGESSAWSIRDGHTYADRSALRFDPDQPGKPRVFVLPSMDPSYDDKPSMISETSWNRPNRYRSEAPLVYAAYGALQDSDAIVHFTFDTASWSTKPAYFVQPWTLMSPAMMGQFPAAALIYRRGLVATGDLLVDLNLKLGDLFDLQGTPMPQDAAFDELRLKDVPQGVTLKRGNVIDPLVHFAGRTNVNFSERGGPPQLKDLQPFVDRRRQVVTSSTGELKLDYGKGVLTINAPAAQGASGNLREAGTLDLKDIAVASTLELGHIIAVSLDDKPLATSRRMLLQAMSEEKPTDFRTEPAPGGENRIVSIGHDPWLVEKPRRHREVQAARRRHAHGDRARLQR